MIKLKLIFSPLHFNDCSAVIYDSETLLLMDLSQFLGNFLSSSNQVVRFLSTQFLPETLLSYGF